MKTKKLNTVVLTFTIFALVACTFFNSCNNPQYEQEIIGRFYYTETIDEEEIDDGITMFGNFESFEEFFKNKKFQETFKIKYTVSYDEGSFSMYYEGIVEGNWEISKSNLYYDYDIESLTLKFVESDAKYDEKEFVREFNYILLPQLKSELKSEIINTEKHPVKIIELNSSRLITRDIDGEETVQKRLRN